MKHGKWRGMCYLVLGSLLVFCLVLCGYVENVALSAQFRSPHIGDSQPMEKVDSPLGVVIFPNGHRLYTDWSIGSSAAHKPGDDGKIFYSMTDRGVNIKCREAKDIIGIDICKDKNGKIFPFPNFTPTIFKWKVQPDGYIKLIAVIKLKDKDGKPVTGLPNPLSNFAEKAYSSDGVPLAHEPNGLDTEALAVLKDGSFWIGEEYGPSILHVSSDGRILERIVPEGIDRELKGANYKVIGALPAILAKRHPNRGIESIAVNPDKRTLYFMMQSPLDNTDYSKTNKVRLYKWDTARDKVTGEYVYELDPPETFKKDYRKRKQKDVKVSDMTILANEAPVPVNLSASIETNCTDVRPVSKTLLFSTDAADGYPSKIEGVANMGNGKLLLINDNDFCIHGDYTVVKIIDLPLFSQCVEENGALVSFRIFMPGWMVLKRSESGEGNTISGYRRLQLRCCYLWYNLS